ncbi:MAG TPA: BatD family protein [bacterium]|nr:BatD family protein [bacterium]HQI48402.1 BatD family protein [bacterium]HQJ64490.1 BatD family protein [bacterium]
MTVRTCIGMVLIWASTLAAQPLNITASVDQTNLTLNQQLVLTIELSGEGANGINRIDLPEVSEFLTLLGSGGTSQSIQIINGKMSVQKSFTYFYNASKEGTFTIPPVSVSVRGQSYSSRPIIITIGRAAAAAPGSSGSASAAAGSAPQPLPASEASDEELFIRALVNKRQVYQNEPVIVTFSIYTRVNVSGYALSKLPESAGFWSEEIPLPQQPQTRNEVINGRKYVVADLKKMAMFPTSPGRVQIGSLGVDCDVRVQARRRSNDIFDSFFDDPFFGRTVRKSVQSRPVSIEVLPFPESGKPADFSGLAGSFDIKATIDKKEVTTNEAITLKVVISGTGNINTIPKPHVVLPRDFEQYEPKVSENIQRTGDRISGSKTFEYVLVPRFAGEQRIRPITLSYFDLASRRYATASTPELIIPVAKGSGDASTVPAGLSKEEVKLIGQDIRFIKLGTPEWRRKGGAFYRSSWFTLLWILPLLALAAAFGWRRHLDKLSGNVAYARSRRANRMAMKRLSRAEGLLQVEKQKEYFAEIARALLGFAADKLDLSEAGMVTSELESRLKQRNVPEATIQQYLQLLKVCDYQRFAPSDVTMTQMQGIYREAKEAIINLEKAI